LLQTLEPRRTINADVVHRAFREKESPPFLAKKKKGTITLLPWAREKTVLCSLGKEVASSSKGKVEPLSKKKEEGRWFFTLWQGGKKKKKKKILQHTLRKKRGGRTFVLT